jgi:hypothetical protein
LQQPRISSTWSISWNTWRPNWLIGLEPERHNRAAVDQRVGHAGDQIGYTWPGCRHADRWRLAQAAVGLARERRRLFVAHVDHPDAFGDAGGLGQQHRAAHDVEDVLDAVLLQALRQDFRTGQFSHSWDSFAGVIASGAKQSRSGLVRTA